MSATVTTLVIQAAILALFAIAALFLRGRSARRVRAYFAREGPVLRVRRVGAVSAFIGRRRIQEFRVQVRNADGVVVTHAAELEGWGPVRRLW